jgi:FKBP-type peptidyl-prolyl cis-trans isomerase
MIQNNKDKNKQPVEQTVKTAEVGDFIVIHYVGKLESGKEFDSSYTKNQPFVFQLGVGQVIKGWDEGLVGVKRGDKKTLKIPADKGYGSQEIKNPNTGEIIIPKDSTLIFDVEVVEVIPKADAERMIAEQQAKEAASSTSATTTTGR